MVKFSADNRASLSVNTTLYSKASLFRACYKFTDKAYLFLSRNTGDTVVVTVTPKRNGVNAQLLILEFANELVDQATREVLEREFGPIRNLIVAQAFSEGNLLEGASTDASDGTD